MAHLIGNIYAEMRSTSPLNKRTELRYRVELGEIRGLIQNASVHYRRIIVQQLQEDGIY